MNKKEKEAKRKKALGELGELFAIKVLVDNRFNNIRNLNDDKRNYPFADLYAEKGNSKYVISIKARNKYELSGKENSFYKLGKNAYSNAKKAEDTFKAEAYWMAIPFDHTQYSIYFGSVKELLGKNAIPIMDCKERKIGDILVKDKNHYFDWDFFINQITKKKSVL